MRQESVGDARVQGTVVPSTVMTNVTPGAASGCRHSPPATSAPGFGIFDLNLRAGDRNARCIAVQNDHVAEVGRRGTATSAATTTGTTTTGTTTTTTAAATATAARATLPENAGAAQREKAR